MNTNLDINRTADRQALIGNLAAREIPALDVAFGGGLHGVAVELIPATRDKGFSVVATGIDSGCEIGLSGIRKVGGNVIDCGSAEFLRPETLDLAADAIQTYVKNRHDFVSDFEDGRYDL